MAFIILAFVCGMVENIVGKRENFGFQSFHLLPRCFSWVSIPGSLKPKDLNRDELVKC